MWYVIFIFLSFCLCLNIFRDVFSNSICYTLFFLFNFHGTLIESINHYAVFVCVINEKCVVSCKQKIWEQKKQYCRLRKRLKFNVFSSSFKLWTPIKKSYYWNFHEILVLDTIHYLHTLFLPFTIDYLRGIAYNFQLKL